MKHTTFLLLLVMPVAILADGLQPYMRLTNAVHDLAWKVRKALPGHAWSTDFEELCRCLDEEILPCSCLRYLVDECSCAINDPSNRLAHLQQPLKACCDELQKATYEIPELSAESVQTYRACCKRRRCLIVDQDLSVAGTIITNNFVETGLINFLNTPLGQLLGYALLYAQGESDANVIADQQFVQFDMIVGASKFISSPQFSLSQSGGLADGISVPAGTYLFYWKVIAQSDGNSTRTPIEFELFSTTRNTVLEGTKFSSDENGNGDTGDAGTYVASGGFGIVVIPQATTLKLQNNNTATYTIPIQPVVQKLLALVRIQS